MRGFPILQPLLLRQHFPLIKVSLIYLSPLPRSQGRSKKSFRKLSWNLKVLSRKLRRKTPQSPITHTHRYALEVWIKVETSPGNFMPPEEESYNADFVLDTLYLTYPECTGVFLAEPGHAIAFYG